MNRHSDTSPRPSQILLHPLWIFATVVLAFNDHFLKTSGLAHPLLTGKLSDFAGMLVAPALMAALFRVRSGRGFLGAHLAVGSVFTAIQLSPEVAQFWSEAMAGLGFAWVITVDPTDLIALPALVVSYLFFGAIARRHSPRTSQLPQLGLGAVGMLFCMGTSAVPEECLEDGCGFADTWGASFLHNATDTNVTVRVRELRWDAHLDCDAIAVRPEQRIPAAAFEPLVAWELPPNVNLAVARLENQDCAAALVDIDNNPTQLVFWRQDDLAESSIPGEGGSTGLPGEIRLTRDDEGQLESLPLSGAVPFLFTFVGDAVEPYGECAMSPEKNRLAWSETLNGTYLLHDVNVGPDGCIGMSLESIEGSDDHDRWFVCLPPELWPFVDDDTVSINYQGAAVSGSELLAFEKTGPFGEELAGDERRLLELHRGNSGSPSWGEVVAISPAERECAADHDADCGSTRVAAYFEYLGSETLTLVAGETAVLEGQDGESVKLAVLHSAVRVAGLPGCKSAHAFPGVEFEVVILTNYGEEP